MRFWNAMRQKAVGGPLNRPRNQRSAGVPKAGFSTLRVTTVIEMPEKACTVLLHGGNTEPPSINELRKALESGSDAEKTEALKKVILYQTNGEPLPQLLMTIIRFVLNSKDHTIKKLCLLYWEVIDLTGLFESLTVR